MKHLKYFENKDLKFDVDNIRTFDKNKYKVNDIIVLIDNDEENASLTAYFKVGNLYKITYIDDSDDLPYRIGYLDENADEELIYAAWVEGYRIRLADPCEIDQNKYNL